MRTCTKCHTEKSLNSFSENRAVCRVCRADQAKARAKADPETTRKKRQAYVDKNRDKINSVSKEWKLKNPEKVKSYRQKFWEANREKINAAWPDYYRNNFPLVSASRKSYYKRNKDKILVSVRTSYSKRDPAARAITTRRYKENNGGRLKLWAGRRRRLIKCATPVWADLEAMNTVYAKRRRLSMWLGEEYHVDHLVPLVSEFVCGLHCEHNLSIMPSGENLSKGNRWWPDMWDYSYVENK